MFESILAKVLFEVLRRPVLRLIPRYWYRLRDRHALPVFKSLHPRVVGLREQVKERDVDDSALAVLAAELEKLSIFPPAIRRERGRASLESELELLNGCMTASANYLSLPLARKHFSRGPLSDKDHTRVVLEAAWDELEKRRTGDARG